MDCSGFMPVAALVLALYVAGCTSSSGDGGGQKATMKVTPSLGLVRNANVRLLDLEGEEIPGARGEIGPSGSAVLQYPASWVAPVIVEVRGDEDAEYFDEATQTFLPFDGAYRIRSYLPTPQDEVGVTPLTELAAAMLERRASFSVADIRSANQAIGNAFAPALAGITQPPLLVDEVTDLYSAPIGQSGTYAAILAALAELGYGQELPALSIMMQLSEDLQDEVLDGMHFGEPMDLITYDPATFNYDFDQALRLFTMGSPLSGVDFGVISTDLSGHMGRMSGGL